MKITQTTTAIRPRTSSDRKKATCPICQRTLLKRALQRHLKAMHQSEPGVIPDPILSCDEYGEVFPWNDNLDRHVNT